MLRILYIVIGYTLILVENSTSVSHKCSNPLLSEGVCLNKMPLAELLQIKKSLEKFSCSGSCEQNHMSAEPASARDVDQSLARELTVSPYASLLNAGKSHNSDEEWKERQTKLQRTFQLTITALSFLTFGGYLLCIIVQAIKSKGTTYYHAGMLTSDNNDTKGVLKRKKHRRVPRSRDFQDRKDTAVYSPTTEELQRILIDVTNSYVNVSTSMKTYL